MVGGCAAVSILIGIPTVGLAHPCVDREVASIAINHVGISVSPIAV